MIMYKHFEIKDNYQQTNCIQHLCFEFLIDIQITIHYIF